jgi:hypothetical protein
MKKSFFQNMTLHAFFKRRQNYQLLKIVERNHCRPISVIAVENLAQKKKNDLFYQL